MICNGEALIFSEPIKNMLHTKEREHGVSYGLAEPARYTGKYQGAGKSTNQTNHGVSYV